MGWGRPGASKSQHQGIAMTMRHLFSPEEHHRAVKGPQEVPRTSLGAASCKADLVEGGKDSLVLGGHVDRLHKVIVDVKLIDLFVTGGGKDNKGRSQTEEVRREGLIIHESLPLGQERGGCAVLCCVCVCVCDDSDGSSIIKGAS